ncbi:choline-binding protein A, partial [Streptococcus pneumoniae]
WYYLNESGSMATGWVKDKGLWYYLNESGSMATGWVKVSGKWYYTYNSGDLLVNTTTPDGYRVNANGEWVG